MESRRGRCRDRDRGARGSHLAEEGAGGLHLSYGVDDPRPEQFRNDVYAQDEQLLEATAEEAAFFNQTANHPLTAHLAQ